MLACVDTPIKAKHRNELWCKVMFHQHNARTHMSTFTGWTLYEIKWYLLPYLSYNLDIVPSNFYLFSYIQLHFASAIFNLAPDIQNEVVLFFDLGLWYPRPDFSPTLTYEQNPLGTSAFAFKECQEFWRYSAWCPSVWSRYHKGMPKSETSPEKNCRLHLLSLCFAPTHRENDPS